MAVLVLGRNPHWSPVRSIGEEFRWAGPYVAACAAVWSLVEANAEARRTSSKPSHVKPTGRRVSHIPLAHPMRSEALGT